MRGAENSASFQGIEWENNLLSIPLENVSYEWVWKERSHNIESSVCIHWDVYYWIHFICPGQPWQCFLFFIWFVSWESTQDSVTTSIAGIYTETFEYPSVLPATDKITKVILENYPNDTSFLNLKLKGGSKQRISEPKNQWVKSKYQIIQIKCCCSKTVNYPAFFYSFCFSLCDGFCFFPWSHYRASAWQKSDWGNLPTRFTIYIVRKRCWFRSQCIFKLSIVVNPKDVTQDE